MSIANATPVHAPGAEPEVAFDGVDLDLGGNAVLRGIDITIATGEFLCVVGASGCGKTSLLRLIAGLVPPTRGRVMFRGQPVVRPRRDVAIVFQDYGNALLPWRTVEGNVSLALEAMNVPAEERRARIATLLTQVGLAEHAHKYPAALSGGMQQRLQIARCLAQEPRMLLMDEPFGALDAMTRQTLQDEVARLAAATGTTVFFVTHDLEEAIYLGDRVIALQPNPGRVQRTFSVDLARPRSQRTTPDEPGFAELRRTLFDLIRGEAS